ncbi:unnamed protein product [Rhizophagus irregularis]|nr:unnamed protein product [Rhizophagus irregularis]
MYRNNSKKKSFIWVDSELKNIYEIDSEQKKRRAQAANYLIENNDKYIRRYPEKELVRILKESGYHSEEWEETDSDEEMI